MSTDLSPVISTATRWLLSAYPAPHGALSRALAEAQARQAATVAAALRYPTGLDVELLYLLGPGGAGRLDRLTGADGRPEALADWAWRTWVDETVVSWAACLLADPRLAAAAVAALAGTEHGAELAGDAFRLTAPGEHDHDAAPLLRHPDLLDPIAALHRADLLGLLRIEPVEG
ncbi:hypothetical protein ACIGXM_09055 [Kitasatospora sp. NPDC052896]|uniref:hypothetical protein n=1 Tax=Kitasatospora sp. NPDC052896 TaxID=3364061 RepID=UPI0037C7B983